VEVGNTKPFLKGPIPMDWLEHAARLPGKALNLALALRWLVDMNGGKPTKLTAKALVLLNVSEDACSDGLRRLETAGLITVTRQPGQRPTVGYSTACPASMILSNSASYSWLIRPNSRLSATLTSTLTRSGT
jgi:hypothetical protein